MTLGMSLPVYTFVHVLLSVTGLFTGFIAMFGFLGRKRMDGWNGIFLGTTVLTSVTGFGFPFERLLPSHILGIISLVVLAVALVARYSRHLEGGWSRVYAISAELALYLNAFVAVVQAFRKIPALTALAPTQSEIPFVIAQALVLAGFVLLGVLVVRMRGGAPTPAATR